jgi:DNA-binding transcriptional MocR family regulator
MWSPTDVSPLGPVYLAIADALARDVAEGRLAPGERLPTHRALARQLGVNVVTITRAYQEAARRGLVEGEVGRGTFVRERAENVLPGMPVRAEDESAVVDLHVNSSACGAERLDVADLLAELARDAGLARLFQTGYAPLGFPHHREAGAAWIRRGGLDADPDRVLITTGVQHALNVVLGALLEPGETLLVEELTYAGVRALAGLLRLKLQPLPLDAEGVDPDALELACKKGLARALYLQPTVQNPTGAVMSAERRARVAAIARRYRLPVIEDDTSGYLLADGPAPIAAELPELAYFLSGTSKSIAPGLRVAYAHVPAAAVERIAANLAATTWMTAPLQAEIAARLVVGGAADRVVAAKRAEAVARRSLFDSLLGSAATASHPCSAHVWLPLPAPWRGADFVAGARARGVAVAPAEHFVVGRGGAPHAVRLALGRPEHRADVERALAAIAEMLTGAPTCASIV